jgi:uncharacterized protein YndB with AHSA1/START domain
MTDAENDLVLTRVLDAPRDKVWRCWVEPELLKQWFCPKPWYVSEARIDLRPGGEFYTVMNGPNGEQFGEPGGAGPVGAAHWETSDFIVGRENFRPP